MKRAASRARSWIGGALASAVVAIGSACATSSRPDPAPVASVEERPAPDAADARDAWNARDPGAADARARDARDPRVARPGVVARPSDAATSRAAEVPPGGVPGRIGAAASGTSASGSTPAGPAPEIVKGKLTRGDSTIDWTATLDAGRIARVVETIRMGGYGEARATYDVAPDGSVEYAGRELVEATDAEGRSARQLIETRMSFSPAREPVRTEKLVNGVDATVDASEPAGVLAHLEMLTRTVREARPGAR